MQWKMEESRETGCNLKSYGNRKRSGDGGLPVFGVKKKAAL